MSDVPQLNGNIEDLKNGDFTARSNWFHREFSNDIEGAVKTGQELMYFWAVARSYFKAWLFKQTGKPIACANLVKSARAKVAVIWGTGDDAARALENAKQMANDMVMCHKRMTHTVEERQFIETFSTDDNPKDFRAAVCRTMKEFESEKDGPDDGTSLKYEVHQC